MIDIGVNLSSKRFKDDIGEVLTRAREAGVQQMVLTGTSLEESQLVIDICDEYTEQFPAMLFATCGIHPHDASSFNNESLAALRDLSTHPQVVAIGEAGLDFNRNLSSPKQQAVAFEAQLELAAELQMPVFLHERDAAKRQLEILNSYRDAFSEGVIHCFTGDKKTLFSYLEMDLHIGITGWVCDERRGLELKGLVKNIPLQRLLIETDSPYLLPRNMHPVPKDRRNEPAFLPFVLSGIADARKETPEEIRSATSANAARFFKLPVAD
jgi:TatD DNase family protein